MLLPSELASVWSASQTDADAQSAALHLDAEAAALQRDLDDALSLVQSAERRIAALLLHPSAGFELFDALRLNGQQQRLLRAVAAAPRPVTGSPERVPPAPRTPSHSAPARMQGPKRPPDASPVVGSPMDGGGEAGPRSRSSHTRKRLALEGPV